MRASFASVGLLLVMVTTGAQASAEEAKPDYAAAKRHFKNGQQLLQIDRHAEAIVEFKKAYEITKDGLVMGQVAQAYAKAGDYVNALAAMRIYREALPEGERGSADALIREYEKAVKDGRSKTLVLPGEQAAEPQPPKAEEGATPPAPAEQPRRSKGRLWTWVAAGAAGALAVSALVVGLNAQSKYDELADRCKPSCHQYQSDIDAIRTRAIAADVLWGTAAAAAVTAGVLFFVEGRRLRKETVPSGDEGDEELTLRPGLQVQPVMGAGRYGINAALTF